MNISDCIQLIENNFGIYIDSFNTGILEKAIEQRMELLNIKEDNSYFDCIRQNEFELKNLVSLLTVNESYFFREDIQLELLVNTIMPQLISQKNRDSKIRIVSAGCSTGEEPYSIAIALSEKFGPQIGKLFQFFAFDVNTQVIDKAKQGVYGKSSFRTMDKNLQSRYFTPLGVNKKQIDLYLRKQVSFFEHNLLNEKLPLFLQHIDVIFYRNVSIYFKPKTQKKVFGKLSGILNTNGYLFTSATETFVHDMGILDLNEFSNCFVFKNAKSHDAGLIEVSKPDSIVVENYPGFREEVGKQLESIESESNKKMDLIREMDTHHHFNKALQLLKFNKQTEALKLIELVGIQHPESNKLNILKSRILYELNQISDAKLICLGLIEKDQWYVWPYLYLGLFAFLENNSEELVNQLKKAIYVQPTCWLAHYYLANHYFSKSLFESAVKEMRNVIRLLEKQKISIGETELFLEPLSVNGVITEFKEKLAQMQL